MGKQRMGRSEAPGSRKIRQPKACPRETRRPSMSQGSDSSEVLCSIVIRLHLQNTNSKIKIFKNFTTAITEYSTPSFGPFYAHSPIWQVHEAGPSWRQTSLSVFYPTPLITLMLCNHLLITSYTIFLPFNPHSILSISWAFWHIGLVISFLYLKTLQWFLFVLRTKFHKSCRKQKSHCLFEADIVLIQGIGGLKISWKGWRSGL